MHAEPNTMEDRLAEKIYDDILTKIIVEVTCGLHRAAKTGVLPYSDVMAGSVVRDEVDENDGGNNNDIDQDAGDSIDVKTDDVKGADVNDGVAGGVIVGEQQADKKNNKNEAKGDAENNTPLEEKDGSKKRKLEGSEEARAERLGGDSKTTNISKTTSSNLDIWGRPQTKEPKYQTPCPQCGKNVSVPRFAQHLEKCMGLSGRAVLANNSKNNNANNNNSASSLGADKVMGAGKYSHQSSSSSFGGR